jgi:integrase
MAKPRGMFQREGIWNARKDVPKPLREIIGKTSLQESLHTRDLNDAKVHFHGVMQRFEAEIANGWRVLRQEPRQENPLTFDVREMGFSQADIDAYALIQASKPENKIQQMLADANLIREKPEPLSMAKLFDQWKAEKQPKLNTAAEYEKFMQSFQTVCGELPIAAYTVEHIRKWKQHVVALPGIAHSTREKWFGSIRTLFRFANRSDYLNRHNPFENIILETPNRPKVTRRQEWEPEELQKLFDSPVFVDGLRPRAGAGEAAFWVPILALWHGLRLAEICQLRRADLVQRKGIACLLIRPSAEEDDQPEMSLKTKKSERVVPLHRAVIELGFLDYVRTVRGTQMFPMIRPDVRGRWSGHFSKWFGRYRKSIGLDQRWTDFHSLRHGWKTAARAAKIPKEHHDEITGHDAGDVGSSYGSVPIDVLKQELDRVEFAVKIPRWEAGAYPRPHRERAG